MTTPTKTLSTFAISAVIFINSFFGSLASATQLEDVDHQAVTIWSQGVRLAGDIYKPKDLTDKDKLPAILLVAGWDGSKENLKKNYVSQFAEQGFIVLAFDF
jgi:fermentation-respiration switch protein FrsA (DUF1100 family)